LSDRFRERRVTAAWPSRNHSVAKFRLANF